MSNEAGRFKIGALSRITGLKPELLRAWQRRFQLFEPERTQGGQRLYTPDDLRVAVYVRDLLARGRSIGAVPPPGPAVPPRKTYSCSFRSSFAMYRISSRSWTISFQPYHSA